MAGSAGFAGPDFGFDGLGDRCVLFWVERGLGGTGIKLLDGLTQGLAGRAKVAHEALLRGIVDGREVPGGDLFFVAESAGWLHRLDRIGREAAVTGAAGWLGDADLFVNFSPRSVFRAQVFVPADLTSATPESPTTCTGALRLTFVPSPSWP